MSFSKPSNDADVREPVQVVYDAQCPLCTLYCEQAQQNIRLGSETDYGMTIELELVDARKDSLLLAEITRLGLDIDDGMVVKTGDSIHYGADAIHTLTGYSRKGGFFVVVSRLLFGSAQRARWIYPWLRRVRNLILALLGRRRINNLKLPGRDRWYSFKR